MTGLPTTRPSIAFTSRGGPPTIRATRNSSMGPAPLVMHASMQINAPGKECRYGVHKMWQRPSQ